MPAYKKRMQKGGENGLDVRSDEDIPALEAMMGGNQTTFVLIYADWCGHCHRYMPTWDELQKIPGRTANMAKVHHDMQEKISALKDAKIQGYPSVVKVLPSGKLEEYRAEANETTNAIQSMRDMKEMERELKGKAQSGGAKQVGGELMTAFVGAIQAAGPSALLLLAHGALQDQKKQKGGYKPPKRQTRRGRSRRARHGKTRRFARK